MNTEGLTKINQLLQKLPSGSLFFSTWMKENGISYELQRHYRKSRWLTSLATGVMIRTGDKATLFSALSCLYGQAGKCLHIGALSALELLGYSHFVPMGRQRIVVYCPREEWFPEWLQKYDWGVDVLKTTSEIFDSQTGITTSPQSGFEVRLSSPERAFLESLSMIPKYYNPMDLYYVMEHLTSLRPDLLQSLLEQSNSLKVNRLFLYMAEKANHAWFEMLDLSKISLGSGKRAIIKNGVYNAKYQIVIPEELNNYE